MDSLVDPAQNHVTAEHTSVRRAGISLPAIWRAGMRRAGDEGRIITADSGSPDRRVRRTLIRHVRFPRGKQHKIPRRTAGSTVTRWRSEIFFKEDEAGPSHGALPAMIAVRQLQRRGSHRRGHGGARHRETGSPRGCSALPHGQRSGGQQEHAADDDRPWRGCDSEAITSRLSDAGKTADDTGPGRRQSRDSRRVAAVVAIARHQTMPARRDRRCGPAVIVNHGNDARGESGGENRSDDPGAPGGDWGGSAEITSR